MQEIKSTMITGIHPLQDSTSFKHNNRIIILDAMHAWLQHRYTLNLMIWYDAFLSLSGCALTSDTSIVGFSATIPNQPPLKRHCTCVPITAQCIFIAISSQGEGLLSVGLSKKVIITN